MHNLDTYMKTKHDLANQLQLLDAYFALGQIDKAERLAKSTIAQFRDEQQLLRLNCPTLIQYYINTVLEERLFEWSFEIEHLTSAIGNYDSDLKAFIESCVLDYKERVETKSLLTLSLFDSDSEIKCLVALTGEIIDATNLLSHCNYLDEEMIEYELVINKK
ncbi:Spo0B domain-containing protein [Macrococcus animalis]|uniref:Spo0B domain-containing protein n=1 Tax=Macrococcus animalis TaxID=3395467 RepID=UPI0039BEA0EE